MRALVFIFVAVAVVGSCGGRAASPQSVDAHFPCGSKPCDARAEYCERSVNGVSGPMTETCKPLPRACSGSRDCACFPESTPCALFKMCSAAPAGDRVGFTLMCPEG